jgi:hypothetical protein
MVGRRVGMWQGWCLGEKPGSDNERCLRVRQAAGEEKARHAHCGTGLLDVVVAALIIWPMVVCDGSTAGFFFTHLDDTVEFDHVDDQVPVLSSGGPPFRCESSPGSSFTFVARCLCVFAQESRGWLYLDVSVDQKDSGSFISARCCRWIHYRNTRSHQR